MFRYCLLIFFISILVFSGCSKSADDKPLFMATTYPVYVILAELTGDAAKVDYIVPTGASPHTYLPKPGDIKKTSKALGLFYIADNFDGWISGIPTENKIKLLDMIPDDNLIYFSCNHDHSMDAENHNHSSEIDPHFWLDPLTVKAMIGELTEKLVLLFPAGEKQFKSNAEKFSNELDEINKQLESILRELEGKELFLHHPSFNYLINRYNLVYAGSIEESPGKEPSPKFLTKLVGDIKQSGVKSIFSEPQLNGKTARVIAREAGVNLFEINPEGNSTTMNTYRDLLIKNAQIINKALK